MISVYEEVHLTCFILIAKRIDKEFDKKRHNITALSLAHCTHDEIE